MEDDNLADLLAALAALEDEEAQVSAERRHLHRQIDFGYASDTTRTREREVSDHRRELHLRIDAIRESLGMRAGAKRASAGCTTDPVTDDIGGLERIADPTQRIDASADNSPIF